MGAWEAMWGGEVAEEDAVVGAEAEGVVEGVAEFADVAGPGVGLEG